MVTHWWVWWLACFGIGLAAGVIAYLLTRIPRWFK